MSKTLRRLSQAAFFALFSLGAGTAFAQATGPVGPGEGRGTAGGCPNPVVVTLNVGNPVQADFSAASWAARVGLNYAGANKQFLGTFAWTPPSKCCEIVRAILTVNMKANSAGSSATTSDAGNDTVSVQMTGGAAPPIGGAVYSTWPFAAGATVTKTFTITGTALTKLLNGNGLSIAVQDDTMVISATLSLSGCCLSR